MQWPQNICGGDTRLEGVRSTSTNSRLSGDVKLTSPGSSLYPKTRGTNCWCPLGRSRGSEKCFGVFWSCVPLRPAERIEHQLHATGDAQFVEDANEVISYGVFAQVKLECNRLVPHAVGYEAHHVSFAWRQPSHSAGLFESSKVARRSQAPRETPTHHC